MTCPYSPNRLDSTGTQLLKRLLIQVCFTIFFAACSAGQGVEAPASTPSPTPFLPARLDSTGNLSEAAMNLDSSEQTTVPQPVLAVDIHCTETDPHPLGQSIAGTYKVSYEQVMTWFCSGISFDNILIALETSTAAGIPANLLLEMHLQGESWETIWDTIGFVEQS
jgi:hypothetical protein